MITRPSTSEVLNGIRNELVHRLQRQRIHRLEVGQSARLEVDKNHDQGKQHDAGPREWQCDERGADLLERCESNVYTDRV